MDLSGYDNGATSALQERQRRKRTSCGSQQVRPHEHINWENVGSNPSRR